MQLNILVNSCTCSGTFEYWAYYWEQAFFVCPFTEQRPTYYKDTTNLCMIHVYYIIVTIIIMHYNKSSIYHGIYSIIIMIAIASLIVFAEVTGERVTGKQELRI